MNSAHFLIMFERMKGTQKHIYYSTEKVSGSASFTEYIKKSELEVIFMTEPADKYVIQCLKDYRGKELICVTKECLQFQEEDKKLAEKRMKKRKLDDIDNERSIKKMKVDQV